MHTNYTTPQGKEIVFNSQQSDAIDKILTWLDNPESLLFTLSGYAGTGKTTLINYVIEDLDKVVVSAPTHKAKIIISKATGRKGETIQSLLGLRPNTDLENFDIKNPQFHAIGEKLIEAYSLVVLDEASMLNTDLFDLLVAESKVFKTKLLFMGDEAQLPPVKEAQSKVFTVEDMAKLTKVERQSSDNPLMSVYDSIRDNIESKDDVFLHETKVQDGKGITFHTDALEFNDRIVEAFTIDPAQNKIIAYTNACVGKWNNLIREQIIGSDKRLVEPGDILMCYNTMQIGKNKEDSVYNSADYRVMYVKGGISKSGIKVYTTALSDVDDEESQIIVQIVINEKENLKKYKKLVDQILEDTKGTDKKKRAAAWRSYFEFKKHHLLMESMSGVTKDFDYGYAITVHKSQGSTYSNVFVDEVDIDHNRDHIERNKLKYVAFSRPTHNVHSLMEY